MLPDPEQIKQLAQLQAEHDDLSLQKEYVLANNILSIPEPKSPAKRATLRALLLEQVPPEMIAQKQKDCLNAVIFKEFLFGKNYTKEQIRAICKENGYEIFILRKMQRDGYRAVLKIPNYEYIDRSLDKLYKLLGEYAPEKHQITRPLAEMTEEELDEIINKSQMARFADLQAKAIDVTPN